MKRLTHPEKSVVLSALCGGLFVALAYAPQGRAQATATLTTLHAFSKDANGQQPLSGLLQARDGNFYGTTSVVFNNGTLFRLAPDGTFTSLFQFGLNLAPDSELIQTSDGSIYGTAHPIGGVSPLHGGIFRLAPDGTVSVVHYFNADNSFTEGADPTRNGLTQASDGSLYGFTEFGGGGPNSSTGGFGTFYRLNADNTLTVLHRFVLETEGGGPVGRPVQASDGNFYGVTEAGGAAKRGTVFRLTPDGTLTVLHTFRGGVAGSPDDVTDGSEPVGGLVQGSDGYLYGTTTGGGGGTTVKGFAFRNGGTVFRISLTGEFALRHSFGGNFDGTSTQSRLIQAKDGNFYGVTGSGGRGDATGKGPLLGTVFQLTPDGTLTTLHSFSGPDGGTPVGNLTQATDGSFYGTTSNGTTNDTSRYGTLFRFTVEGGAHANFFDGEVALGNGVFYLKVPNPQEFSNHPDFGYYSYLSDPHYIYHFDLGYEYVFNANDGKSGAFLYDFKSGGFFYTSPSFPFPYLYDFSLNAVLYYFPDPSNEGRYNTNGVRYFVRLDTGAIISK